MRHRGYYLDNYPRGCGTAFSLTPPSTPGGAWTFNVIYYFPGGASPGGPNEYPWWGLAIGPGGVLFGTTTWAVFSLTPPATAGGSRIFSALGGFASNGHSGVALGSGPTGATVLYADEYGATGTSPATAGIFSEITSLPPTPIPPGGTSKQTVLLSTLSEEFVGGLAVGAGGVLYGTEYSGFSCNGCAFTASLDFRAKY